MLCGGQKFNLYLFAVYLLNLFCFIVVAEERNVVVTLIKQTSLAFVIDDTGSMGDDVDQVRKGTEEILKKFLERKDNPIKNYVLSVFNDPGITPVLVTEDTELYKRKLAEIRVNGGGDCPELALGGIKQALESSLPGAYIYVFTDASAKDSHLSAQVNALAQKKNAHITFVLTGKCSTSDSDPQYLPYVDLAKSTGGQLFQLGKKTEVGTVLNFVKETLDARTVYIVSETIPLGGRKIVNVDVDSGMSILTIVVSGKSPQIEINDPSGNPHTGVPKVNLDSMKVMRVESPVAGRWEVIVTASSPNSAVHISTLSDISFEHGFSLTPVTDIDSTSDKPVKDQSNFLYIKPIPSSWNPTTVEIITTDGHIQTVLPLKPLPGTVSSSGIPSTPIYESPRFRAPNTYFKVVVYGLDTEKNIVKRITNIAIEPEAPAPPKIIPDGKPTSYDVKKNDEVTFNCFASGTNPTITWLKDGIVVTDFKNIDVLDRKQILVIKSAELAHSGKWTCNVKNSLGEITKDFTVRVQSPPVLNTDTEEYRHHPDDEAVLKCDGDGDPKPEITWEKDGISLTFNAQIIPENSNKLIRIHSIKDVNSGKYICIVKNSFGILRKTHIVIVEAPRWSDFSDWSECSTSCGPGVQSHSRKCFLPAIPSKSSVDVSNDQCSGPSSEIRNCMLEICSVDGGWSLWSSWTPCSKSCGVGSKSRRRICDNPTPVAKGKLCEGDAEEVESCIVQKCIYDWSDWSSWSPCSLTCDGGTRSRQRICRKPIDAKEEDGSCIGSPSETSSCYENPCPKPRWKIWGPWSSCSTTCDPGIQTRVRECFIPAGIGVPEIILNNEQCSGSNVESQKCEVRQCDVDGKWSNWSDWSSCSKSCGVGKKWRKRACDNPKPIADGKPCTGPVVDVDTCEIRKCIYDWGVWSEWSTCTATCGRGKQWRKRNCLKPSTALEKDGNCLGLSYEGRYCNEEECPIDGGWTSWTDWSSCTVTCGKGYKNRHRECKNPAPAYGGNDCVGPKLQVDYCDNVPCKIDGAWSTWSDWSECSTTCGYGNNIRVRSCNSPKPAHGGEYCKGSFQDVRVCSGAPCPIHGGWTEWTEWTECNARCGTGMKYRYRRCENPIPSNGGEDCAGSNTETDFCESKPCIPKYGNIHVTGILNNEIIDQYIQVEIINNIKTNKIGLITTSNNLLSRKNGWFPYLPFLVSSISWSLAREDDGSSNGLTLTHGKFNKFSNIKFKTGDDLFIHHIGHGVGPTRTLDVDVKINGSLPILSRSDTPKFQKHLREKYIQIGPGSVHASSKNVLNTGTRTIPFEWTNSVSYDSSLGTMPSTQQRFVTVTRMPPLKTGSDNIIYQSTSTVQKIDKPCGIGFKEDPSKTYCLDVDECNFPTKKCSDICENTIGSFICKCPNWLILAPDGLNCITNYGPTEVEAS